MTDCQTTAEHDARDTALRALLHALGEREYAFVTPTPASHARVVARPTMREGRGLADVFGWNLPFARSLLAPDLLALPTPGHTAGHCCLLYQGRVLFSGDHLAWDRDLGGLTAHSDACWFDRKTQLRSVEGLIGLGVERLLPGHGQAVSLPTGAFDAELKALLARERASG